MAMDAPAVVVARGGDLCTLEKRGRVYVLKLEGDGEHRINPNLVDSILSCLSKLPQTASALITTSHGKFFSNGLDLSHPSRTTVGSKFQDLIDAYLHLPMPTIAAVCGHASAGGFIFALAHDHVLMRNDRGFLYMSEIDIAILIPQPMMNLIRYKMPPMAFRDTVLCGVKHTASMAFSAGIIDSIHKNSETTMDAALQLSQKLAARNWNPVVYRDMRMNMYPEVFRELDIAYNRTQKSKVTIIGAVSKL